MSKSNDLKKIGQDVELSQSDPSHAKAEQRRLFEKEEGVHKRNQQTKTHMHWVQLISFWLFMLLGSSFLVVWTWHLLTPNQLQFLTDEQLDIIQPVLVSIVGSSFIAGYVKSWLSRHTD